MAEILWDGAGGGGRAAKSGRVPVRVGMPDTVCEEGRDLGCGEGARAEEGFRALVVAAEAAVAVAAAEGSGDAERLGTAVGGGSTGRGDTT